MDGIRKTRKKDIRHFRDWDVYQEAFNTGMKIFQMTPAFPPDEKYSLVSRDKPTDAVQEASETQSGRESCVACKYVDENLFKELDSEYVPILAMLNKIEQQADGQVLFFVFSDVPLFLTSDFQ